MASTEDTDINDKFKVSTADAVLGSLVHNHRKFWLSMGNLESKFLKDAIEKIEIKQPIFIAGLARSGTTILLELMSLLKETGTHQYRDFPPVFTPYLWNWFIDHSIRQTIPHQERAHADRIYITPESPEAMEEPIWMAYFPAVHDPSVSNLLDSSENHPAFEQFYFDHIRKILMIRKASRYVSKGNYNISRLEYLLHLFPDARFIIPVREPAAQIASLMKQHILFYKLSDNNRRARNHLRWVGHFEFGPDRCPINMGDTRLVEEIRKLWTKGEEVQGSARYWSHIYGAVADQLDASEALRNATIIVRYEDFCRFPLESIQAILSHTKLQNDVLLTKPFSEKISFPTYYSWPYSTQDLEMVRELTSQTATRLGYSEKDVGVYVQ